MVAKVYFRPDGYIHMIQFKNILGAVVGTVGKLPPVTDDKLEIITVYIADLGNLVDLLNNL